MNRDPNFDYYSFPLPKKTEEEPTEQGTARADAPSITPPLPDPAALRAMRRTYSRVGWAFFAMVFAWYTVSELLFFCYPSLLSSWLGALFSTVPLYVVGIPVLLLSMTGLPRAQGEVNRTPVRAGLFFALLAVSFTALLGGNLLGSSLMDYLSKLTQTTYENAVESLFDIPMWASLLITLVLSPFFEELIFRKLLLDRLLPHGEVSAIVVSSLLFGLIHGNFYQFFYAVAIGCVLGYAYVRTGKLWPGVLIHVTVNLVCGVLASSILRLLDYDALLALTENLPADPAPLLAFVEQNFVGVLLLLLYSLLVYSFAIAGVVLLILHHRKIRFEKRPNQPPTGFWVSPALMNSGMIASLLLGGFLFLVTLLSTVIPAEEAMLLIKWG